MNDGIYFYEFFFNNFIVLCVTCCAIYHVLFMDIMRVEAISVQGVTNGYISFLFLKISFKIYLLAYHTL